MTKARSLRSCDFIFLCALFALCFLRGAALAQNEQYTRNTPDSNLRSDLQVDPSTLGLSFSLPMGAYGGRGAPLPIGVTYGSKLWRMQHVLGSPGFFKYINQLTAQYAENSVSGWTASTDPPYIDFLGAVEIYDEFGGTVCTRCVPEHEGTIAYINRVLLHMPDGSTHELRKDDDVYYGVQPPFHPPLSGVYLAVDGSRIKYDADTTMVYLPDGSRYWLTAPTGAQYIDRNGNTLIYNSVAKQWTDTLGRVINAVPLSNATTGDVTYTIPGFNGSNQQFIFRWRRLGDSGVRTDGSQPLRFKGSQTFDFPVALQLSPYLFGMQGGDPEYRACDIGGAGNEFNPVVLYEIQLPNGAFYRFTYNVWGEIDKVLLPSGGYERFEYTEVSSLSDLLPFFSQTNRGVIKRWVSVKGDGTDEALLTYGFIAPPSASTVTNPNGARVEHGLHEGSGSSTLFGFDDARTGRAYEERTYNASGQMIRRTLMNWTVDGPLPGGWHSATRNPRPTKKVEILLDTGGDALAATTTTSCDSDLNEIAISRYDFVPVNQTAAQTGDINSFPLGTLLRTEETTFLVNDTNVPQATRDAYRARHLISLPSYTRVKNGGVIVAETQFKYDEPAYPLLTYGVTPTGWTNPGVNERGNVTTTRNWLNVTGSTAQTYPNGSFLETHAQYDQCGNSRKVWDGNGKITEIFYTDSFSDGVIRNTFAYATSVTTPIPDPTGASGSDQPLTSSTIFDFNTGKAVTTTDANNKTTSYFYTDDGGALDSLQRLRRVTLPEGLGETKYEYGDAPGDLYTRTLTKQNATTWLESRTNFDGLGRPWRSGHKEGPSSWSVKDAEYDALGRVKRVTNPYFAANLSGATPGNAAWTTTTYDDLNRVLTVTTPDGATVETTYSGNLVTVKDQANKKRRSVTDALGRLANVIEDPDGVAYQTDYSYDTLGNLTVVNQGGQRRYFFYDSLGRLTRAKNPEQSANSSLNLTNPPAYNNSWSLAYSYDANSNLTERTDARGVGAGYSYDGLNRNTVTNYTNGSQTRSVETVYDGAANGKGRLRYERTKESGVNATQTAIDSYDALGRALNKKQSFWRGSDWGTPYVVQQTYDLAGAVKTVTYPSGRIVSYNYDQAGRLNNFTGNLGDGANRNYVTGMQYDAAGSMKREQFGTTIPLYHRRHYNNRGQLFDIRLGTDPNPAYDSDDLNAWAGAAGSWNRGALKLYYSTLDGCHVYGNGGTDNNGNPLRIDHHIPTDDAVSNFVASIDRYNYDSLNRLKSVTEITKGPAGENDYHGVFRQTFIYDRWGNRTIDQANTTGGANSKAYIVDTSTNRLQPPGGTGTMQYDAAGNLQTDNYTSGASQEFVYDGENRLAEVKNGGVSVSWYVYNAAGRRVVRTVGSHVTWQIYGCGGELLAEYALGAAPSAAQKEYGYRDGEILVVWDGSETGDRQLQWLVQDHLGSTRMVVDRSGSLGGVSRHDFAPFGEELFAGVGIRSEDIGYRGDSVREKFTGYQHDDETDLDFAEARYYSAKQGRFTSPDPLHSSAEPGEPQSWNRYAYVGNRPTLITDPSGLRWAYKVDKEGYKHFAWFNDDKKAEDEGWTVIHGNYFYVGSNGRLIGLYENGGGRDFGHVRRVQQRLSVFRDTQLTNTMVEMLVKSWLAGALGGYAVVRGSMAAAELLPYSAQMGAAMGGIGDEEAGGTILTTTPSGPASTPGNLRLSELTPTEQVRSVSNLKKLIPDIAANGIKEPINYVEHNGVKYIVDGHHRYAAAHHLRLGEVPAQRVSLPYKGYKTVNDLTVVPMSRFVRPLRWIK
jgi:RHS repeat-associated protein